MIPIHRSHAVIAFVALLGACGKPAAPPAATADTGRMQVTSENVAVVDSGVVEAGPSLSGTLRGTREAQLRAQIGGAILATYVDEGQAVAAGTPLALIDTLVIADQARSARSQLRSFDAAYDVAKRNSERAEALHKAGAIADRDLEAARTQATAAEANAADAKSRVSSAEKMLANARITAPFRGVISERTANAGDVVQPGAAIMTLVDPSALEVEASVPSEYLDQVKRGAKVEFSVQGAKSGSVVGTVTRINPTVDPATRQVRIYVSVPNDAGRLAAGLFVDGRVAVKSARALTIPLAALDTKAAVPSVKRIRGGKVEAVTVGLGVRDELAERIEITSGVAIGDTLLIGPAIGTPAGSLVRVNRSDR